MFSRDQMKLRKSIYLIILVGFGLSLAFLILSTRGVTYRKFNEIEEQLIASNVRRSINAIHGINDSLGQIVADWAYWDDTYTFLQDRNQDFIDENLAASTFQAQQNHLIVFFNSARDLVWGSSLFPGAEQLSPVPDGTVESLRGLLGDSLINTRQEGFEGVVDLQGRIFILSCKAVLTTNRTGPSTGWIVMGKQFGPDMLHELELRTELDLDYVNLKTETIAPNLPQEGQAISFAEEFPFFEKTGDTIRCTGVLRDVRGASVALLTVTAPRTIYLSGAEALSRLLIVMSATGVVVGGLIVWLLEAKIMSRIAFLNDQVTLIKKSDPSRFTTLAGSDEISDLSHSIFTMLQKIEKNFVDLRNMQQSLAESEERFRSLFMNTGNPMVVVAEDTTIQLANQEFYRRMKNPEGKEIIGLSWCDFFPPEEVGRIRRLHDARRQDGASVPSTYEARFIDLLGRRRHAILTAAMIPGTTSSTISLLDITDQKQAEAELARKAFYDSLTDLPNRQLFNDRLEHAIKRAIRTSSMIGVFLLDIDEFKSVNDTLGHQAGDTVLQQIAGRLRRCLRKSDTIARLGGDEFAVMIETPENLECLCRIAEKIIADFGLPYLVHDVEFYLGVSIGISLFPEAGETPDMLLKNADLAMYESKVKGKNRYKLFTHSLNDQAQQRVVIDRFVRNAIATESFAVFYQAKACLDDGRMQSMEALVRGRDTNGSLVSPVEFIPYAESNGLIVPIDLLVLKRACRQTARWHQEGLGRLAVAVNISTRHFRRRSFAEEVADILHESGLPADCLELEITESALMKEIEQAQDALKKFRDMGVSVALDDFGTGYSSLNYLHSLPIQTLKIDRSFIRQICSGTKNTLDLVKVIVSLASSMQMNVVAEGIETEEQLKVLQEVGCRQGQGYLFAKPLPDAEFRELLVKNSLPGGLWSRTGWFGQD
jgi:diguanylate cyclase (GGDEF)-like protein/PAS domain S-box-containing protein